MNGHLGERGSSVIDYVIVNEKAAEEVLEMKIEDRTESDHLSIKVRIQGPELLRGKKENEEIWKTDWSKEGIEEYRKKLEGWTHEKTEKAGLWQEIKDKVGEATRKKKTVIRKEIGKRE